MNESNHTDELLKLSNQLCFPLYVASKELIKHYKDLLEPLGLTYTGYITMLALWESDQITVKALGKKLYLDSGTLTPLLKKLEAKGYVHRERSQSDERQVIVTLTESGKALKQQAASVPRDLLCSMDSDGSPEKLIELRDLLNYFIGLL